jgi:predicted RNA-binding protein with RPS1 domain
VVVSKPKIADRSNPSHVVVDGSNLATEGRGAPSLKQLNEAVLAFMKEYPKTQVTVVVDASFAHRIDKKEAAEFSEAIANGELVTPPAGALGRGDGFVLMIADKVNATVVSNDSYQEFHDHYPWLFEQGRLIGGKPVPHVGWVFVDRLPVRVKTDAPPRRGIPNKTAPIPRPTSRPPGRPTGKDAPSARPAPTPARPTAAPAPRTSGASVRPTSSSKASPVSTSKASAQSAVNSVEQFEAFAAKHAVGARVKGVVESFASHGAYVRIGDVAGYLPVRLMKSPAPRTPREHVKIGDALTLSVSDFNQSRRSIEVSLMSVEKQSTAKAAKPAKRLPVARVLKRRRRRE